MVSLASLGETASMALSCKKKKNHPPNKTITACFLTCLLSFKAAGFVRLFYQAKCFPLRTVFMLIVFMLTVLMLRLG